MGPVEPSAGWRFLIDENLPRDLAERLRAAGHSAEHVIEAGLRGQPDPAVYTYAQVQGDTIITADLGFGNLLQYQPPHAGIVVVRLPDRLAIGQRLHIIADGLALLAGQSLENALVTIEVRRVRVRR